MDSSLDLLHSGSAVVVVVVVVVVVKFVCRALKGWLQLSLDWLSELGSRCYVLIYTLESKLCKGLTLGHGTY